MRQLHTLSNFRGDRAREFIAVQVPKEGRTKVSMVSVNFGAAIGE